MTLALLKNIKNFKKYFAHNYADCGYFSKTRSDSGFSIKFDYFLQTKYDGLRFILFADYGRISGERAPEDKDIYSAGYGIEYRKKLLFITQLQVILLKSI